MMKVHPIIWRESVYKNDFVCRCGEQLMKDGEISKAILYDEVLRFLICPKCKNNVALLSKELIEVDENIEYKQGLWEGEFE